MKPKIVIGVLLIVGALAYLIIGGFQDTAVYYMTVPELYAKGDLPQNQGVRVSGYVVPESIQWDASAIKLDFAMAENGDTLLVTYNGIMPDQLGDAQQVVVEGLIGNSGVLTAEKIFLKCPSKYEEKDRGY